MCFFHRPHEVKLSLQCFDLTGKRNQLTTYAVYGLANIKDGLVWPSSAKIDHVTRVPTSQHVVPTVTRVPTRATRSSATGLVEISAWA